MASPYMLLVVSLAAVSISACRQDTRPPEAAAALVESANLALAQMGRYDFSAAVEAFTTLSAAYPDVPEVSFNLALALTNRQGDGDAAQAERLLAGLVDTPPVAVRARYALGVLRLYGGRDAEAFPLLRDVAGVTPGDAFPAYFAGQARLGTAPEDALDWFVKAQTLDPLLRSAFYGAFQALQRMGRAGEAAAMLARFQALESHPRAVMAEFKYTRMGPMAEAIAVDRPVPHAAAPEGPRFAAPVRLGDSAEARWREPRNAGASITLADVDGDGALDVFAAGVLDGPASNALLFQRAGTWRLDLAHPLASVPDVRAALWGDIDDDGLIDVVLLRPAGRTSIWRQSPTGVWRDVTGASRAATLGIDAVDGALVDADHDGDLDIWLVNAAGPNELLNNNANGTFQRIGATSTLAGDGRPSTGVAVADLDGDRDHDLVVLKRVPPHDVFLNDRVWAYRPAPGFDTFRAAPFDAVVAGDLDVDGQVELYTAGPRGIERWTPGPTGAWEPRRLADPVSSGAARLALADTDGDGALELVASRGRGWTTLEVRAEGAAASAGFDATDAVLNGWAVAQLDPARGPSIVGVDGRGFTAWPPGPGRHGYLSLAATGRDQASDQRRSNVSGLGTRMAVRTGTQWTAFDTARPESGPGQSLQPFGVGLGGARQADFVSLTWPDGVLQTEMALEGGRLHRIEETQRQLSSCPVLFSDDGTGFRFVTDILGVGGIGFFEQPGVYSPPFPRERVLLPDGSAAARDGRYRFVVAEPMEELTYLDAASLVAYDLPPGWQMALDERKAIAGPSPTGAPIFFRDERLPSRAVNDRGQDVTEDVARADLRAAPPGAVDARFIGLTAAHMLELQFDVPIDRGPGAPVLMIDGWVEYPYAQTVFGAWQAGIPYTPPTLEAQDGAGRWHVVAAEFGYPAGMPRRMTLPLPALPPAATALRLRTTQEIYWDRVAIVYSEPLPAAVVHELTLVDATLRESGFATRHTGPQRTPSYDYARRAPLLDTRHPRGWYTRFGAVAALVDRADDAVAIFGPGEEVQLEFAAPDAPVARGWTRRVVLDARGWCKDMDLYTKDGETVLPLPGRDTPARRRLHAQFNTRYEGGT